MSASFPAAYATPNRTEGWNNLLSSFGSVPKPHKRVASPSLMVWADTSWTPELIARARRLDALAAKYHAEDLAEVA